MDSIFKGTIFCQFCLTGIFWLYTYFCNKSKTLTIISNVKFLICGDLMLQTIFLCNIHEIKGTFSDSNNIILWHESDDVYKKKKKKKKKKSLFPKFQLIPILHLQVMHDYVTSHCSIGYCVELIIVDNNFCENCSHFILKWF